VLRGGEERMWVLARPAGGAGERVHKFDLDLCDDEGRVCVQLRGFATRTPDTSAGHVPEPPADPGTLLLQPHWQAAPLPEGSTHSYGDHIVLLCGVQVDAVALSARLGARCERLPEEDYAAQAELVLARLQELLRAKASGPVLVQVVVAQFGAQQLSAALAGLLRSARLEQPKLLGQVIALERDEGEQALAARLCENGGSPQDVQVRYVDGVRQVLGWRELAEGSARSPWKAGGVYLLTGGLGGLGRIFAREIAQQAAGARLVLTGRRALDEAGRRELQALQALGAQAEYRVLDVAEREALRALLREVQQVHGGLHGIVHGAGVLRDGLLAGKSAQALREVLAPKVAGLLNLDEVSRDIALECFICFSSISAARGNAGQSDYAAANAFMDAFAGYRNSLVAIGRRQGRTLSVNWPLWRDGGMQVDAAVERAMTAATGLVAMSSARGVEALYRAWGSGADQVAVLPGEPARVRALLSNEAPAPASTQPAAEDLRPAVRQLLMQTISALLKVRMEDIDPDVEFNDYGFDSVTLTEFGNRLNRECGTRIAPTLFFEHPTLNGFVAHLVDAYRPLFAARFGAPAPVPAAAPAAVHRQERAPAFEAPRRERADAARRTGPEPIAIIGVSGCFPQAADLEAFWQNLVEGRDSISEVPEDRWDWRAIHGDPAVEDNKTLAKWGGFIDGIGDFDPLYFGISPKEAELMDPQQRLLMMHVVKVIEDAGYSAASLAGSDTALFVGTFGTGYADLIHRSREAIVGYSTTGTVPSVGPNRMSYFLDLHGPSEPVETACSSSLVAIHRGVRAILEGDCELAIVGGVNTMVTPDATLSFSKAGMLSADGRCKTFSDRANGYVRGEGVGMLMLKRLGAAERDGDRIYGLIRGTAENHGGRANSLTAPNPKAQADLLKAAWREAGIDPRTIGYIEAHGTGTSLGDPIEVNGLKAAFRDLYAETGGREVRSAHCGIGSVKTNIGHLELAAGVAGVIKVLLQMRHRTLVPSLHCEVVNPYIELEGSPLRVVRERQDWASVLDARGQPLPRRAGVSSFGFGGVNAHVVLEEYVPSAPPPAPLPVDPAHPALVVLSARNAQRLQDRVRQLRAAIAACAVHAGNLAEAAYTLQVGRDAMEHRLALLAESVEDLAAKLDAVAAGGLPPRGAWRGEVKRQSDELALFSADEDLAQALDAWLAKRKYHKLLELWVKGFAFDWRRLYGDVLPPRVGLPTYPFARERYWVPAAPAAQGAPAPAAPARVTFDARLYGQLLDGLLDASLTLDDAVRQARTGLPS
jgi:polyketide synthase PksN